VIKTKGVYELVEACSQIPNIELRIVGKCSHDVEMNLKEIACKKSDCEWLSIIGEVEHDTVLVEMLQADMFVFPSYTEGFPNVILEAMACSCPIVASNVGAIPEMLNIGKDPCGVCFLPRSEEEVYKAIVSVVDNEQMKSNFAKKAKERVFSNYTIPVVWQQLTDIWRNNI
jgi:glycosyltransferase involved in cell wall biosynthesis